MTVYELIQELSQFKPDTEVVFDFKGTFDADMEATVDLEGEEEQAVSGEVVFDDIVSFDEIDDKEIYHNKVVIKLEY